MKVFKATELPVPPRTGNPRLRALTPMQARSRFRAGMTGNPQLRDKYYRWLRDHLDIKAGMDSRFRAL